MEVAVIRGLFKNNSKESVAFLFQSTHRDDVFRGVPVEEVQKKHKARDAYSKRYFIRVSGFSAARLEVLIRGGCEADEDDGAKNGV